MSKIFALLAVLLIATGAILIAVPREAPAPTRGPSVQQALTLYARARDIAEQVNAPLSILFGIVSLWYSRKRYVVERDGHGDGKPGAKT